MTYSDGHTAKVGDEIAYDGIPGIVVAVFSASGEFSGRYTRSDWSYLQPEGGVLIEDKVHGLLHLCTLDDVVLINRSSIRNQVRYPTP
jgi:hypothetical protein